MEISSAPFSTLWNFTIGGKRAGSSSFDQCNTLNDLAEILINKECNLRTWKSWIVPIRDFISTHSSDLKALDEFFKKIIESGIEKEPVEMLDVLTQIISLDKLSEVVKSRKGTSKTTFENVFDWAQKNAPFCPQLPDNSPSIRFKTECKKFSRIALRLIPQMIDIFLGAFNFLDAHKSYTTLWEKYLLLEIIYKFFVTPFYLVKLLQPILVVSAKVYFAAASIIVLTGIFLSCYQRWLRPLPDEIIHCENLDKKMQMGEIKPKVGQQIELAQLKMKLESGRNVLLVGPSGQGKTTLAHHFIQSKYHSETSEKLRKLTVHQVNCGAIIARKKFGEAEVIDQIKSQINGYENQVLLFFDEFHQIVQKEAAYEAFKDQFCTEQRRKPLFIAAMTFKGYEELIKRDSDFAFRRKVEVLYIGGAGAQSSLGESSEIYQDREIQLILQEFIRTDAEDLCIQETAVSKIIELSKKTTLFPEIGRPARALKILSDAISRCRGVYTTESLTTNELLLINQEQKVSQSSCIQSISPSIDQLEAFSVIEKKQREAVQKLKKIKEQIEKIKEIISHRKELKTEYSRLTHLLKRENQQTKINIRDNEQIRYLWHCFYLHTSLQKRLDSKKEGFKKEHPELPIQLDSDLIEKVYKELILLEKSSEGKNEKEEKK